MINDYTNTRRSALLLESCLCWCRFTIVTKVLYIPSYRSTHFEVSQDHAALCCVVL